MPTSASSSISALSPAALDRIDEQARIALDGALASGIVLALIDRDGNQFVRGYGERVVGTGQLVDEATAFEIGSIGKSFTAIVFMQLAAEGVIDLHTPVTDYLPWFSIQSAFRPITIHDLLTHTSGLPGGDDPVPDARLEVWLLRNAATYAAPGEHFLYSNVGYKTLGLVLEAILDKPYAAIVQERILEPLHMCGAHGAITSSTRSHLAQGYASQYDDRPPIKRYDLLPATWLETDTGDGCLALTASDLARYARMLLQVASGSDSSVLTGGQLQTMRDPHQGKTTPEPTYGYALDNYPAEDGPERFGHSGGMVGYVSQMTIDVTNGVAAVVMANGGADTTGLATFALDVVAAIANDADLPAVTPASDPFDLTAAADLVGAWHSATRTITIEPIEETGLRLISGETEVQLQRSVGGRGARVLIADDSAWTPFPLEVERAKADPDASSDETPPALKLHWGGETFYRAGDKVAPVAEVPAGWTSYVGHYRSYNPWRSNFRIVIREGHLTLIGPYGHASRLIQEGNRFWVEDDSRPASEWLRFDALVDGKTLMARSNLGEVFARFFTP